MIAILDRDLALLPETIALDIAPATPAASPATAQDTCPWTGGRNCPADQSGCPHC